MIYSKYIIVILLSTCFIGAGVLFAPEPVDFKVPDNWPQPTYDFTKNPLTKEGIALGRALFYDPILSRDSTISCDNCHLSYMAFTHVDHDLSHGIGDSIGTRNSLALINLAWNRSFMWDGGVNHLDVQAMAPINHEDEMGEDFENVIAKLQRSKKYPPLFKKAYGSSEITGARMLKAMSQFQLTLVSSGSKYDLVKAGLDTFTIKEVAGYELFKTHCNSCHTEPLFTNHEFTSNGLSLDPTLMDYGRLHITNDPRDSFLFKVPTLRNIEYTKPYMHDGRYRSLKTALTHYTTLKRQHTNVPDDIAQGIPLSHGDKLNLTHFLKTLSDKKFTRNPDYAFPMDRSIFAPKSK